MAITRIPFVPFPPYKVLNYARSLGLAGAGNSIAKLSPKLSMYLFQAESSFDAREYATISIFTSLFWFALTFGLFIFLNFVFRVPANFLIVGILTSAGIGLLTFFYVLIYPRVIVTRKVRELDRNLLFALRHLLIQSKSGIALFDAMVSVSKAKYGLVSDEFNDAVRKISTGSRDVVALEQLALKNPSLYFRRSLWQITNALRAGADIATTLESIINNLSNEQRIIVRKYGSQLNPLAFMYMMFGMIVPSLGITLIISLSTFTGLLINPIYFWGIIAFLIFFNFNFLGIVKSKRPSVEVYD